MMIIECKACSKKLRVPSDRGPLNVRCPSCNATFRFEPPEAQGKLETPQHRIPDDQIIDAGRARKELQEQTLLNGFHTHFKRHGGRVSDGSYECQQMPRATIHEYAKSIRWRAHELSVRSQHRGKHLDAFCDFVDNPRINAQVDRCGNGKFFVGINSGVYLRVQGLVIRLAHNCDPAVRENIVSVRDPITGVNRKTVRGRFAEKDLIAFLRPAGRRKDQLGQLRKELGSGESRSLSRLNPPLWAVAPVMACEFSLYHELMHVIHGHSDYAWSKHSTSRLCETEDYNDESGSGSRQHLEVAADFFASVYLGRMLALGRLPNGHLFETPEDILWLWRDDRPMAAFLLAFSVCCLMALFDLDSASMESYQQRVHPHPELRVMSFLDGLNMGLEFEMGREAAAPHMDMAIQGYHELVRAFEQAGMSRRAFPYSTNRAAGYRGDGPNQKLSSLHLDPRVAKRYFQARKEALEFNMSQEVRWYPILSGLNVR